MNHISELDAKAEQAFLSWNHGEALTAFTQFIRSPFKAAYLLGYAQAKEDRDRSKEPHRELGRWGHSQTWTNTDAEGIQKLEAGWSGHNGYPAEHEVIVSIPSGYLHLYPDGQYQYYETAT